MPRHLAQTHIKSLCQHHLNNIGLSNYICTLAFCSLQAEDEVSVIKVDSSWQIGQGRDPSARAAVAQFQDAVNKQEVGLGLAALPQRMLSDISQDVGKLTRGLSSGGNFLLNSSAKILRCPLAILLIYLHIPFVLCHCWSHLYLLCM